MLVAALAAEAEPSDGSATAEATVSLQPAIVVLKDTTRLEATWVSRNADEIVVGLTDGTTMTLAEEAVDLEASVGIPASLPKTRARGRLGPATDRRRGLAALAGTTKLKLPAKDETQSWTELDRLRTRPGGGPADAAAEATKPDVELSKSGADPEILAALRADISALATAWGRYGEAVAEVRSRCGGYAVATSSACNKAGVVSKRHTAHCRNAVTRARARLPALQQSYDRLWVEARRGAVSPRQVRAMLAASGLGDFREQLRRAHARLDTWQE